MATRYYSLLAAAVMATVSFQLTFLTSAADPSSTPQPLCSIPAGHYDGEPTRYFDQEPRGSGTCYQNSTTQRIVRQCSMLFCCEDECSCDTPQLLKTSYTTVDTCQNRQVWCYIERLNVASKVGICCDGTVFVAANRSCQPIDKCANNSLGCQHQCSVVQTGTTSTAVCTCPQGYELNPADNRTCRDTAPVVPPMIQPPDFAAAPVRDSTSSSPPGTGATAASVSEFPRPYVAAVVVSAVFLLVLLALLLFFCCWRRRRRLAAADSPTEAFANGVYGKSGTGLPPAYTVEVDEKKKAKFDPDDEITIIPSDDNKPKQPPTTTSGIYETIGDKLPDDDPTVDMGRKARQAAAAVAAANKRAEPNAYVSLPRQLQPPPRIDGMGFGTTERNADAGGDGEYAEIDDRIFDEKL